MKKIKLIVSDMHLGKGKILENGSVNKLEEFFFGEKFAELLDYYTSGKFRDYEVELIINGDFLNFLQVDYNGHFLTVFTEDVSLDILKDIIEGQPEAIKAMKEFAKKPGNQITYVVGNHDQAMLWPKLRSYLNEVIGVPIRYKSIVHFFDGIHVGLIFVLIGMGIGTLFTYKNVEFNAYLGTVTLILGVVIMGIIFKV